jgi:hypothetical protein
MPPAVGRLSQRSIRETRTGTFTKMHPNSYKDFFERHNLPDSESQK